MNSNNTAAASKLTAKNSSVFTENNAISDDFDALLPEYSTLLIIMLITCVIYCYIVNIETPNCLIKTACTKDSNSRL